MKYILLITLSLVTFIAHAQWPNSADKRLTIRQTKNYQIISKTETDNTGNTFLVMRDNIYNSRSNPSDTHYFWNYFQKLDKQGVPQWNLDSTKVLCDEYKMLNDKDGGIYILSYITTFPNNFALGRDTQVNCTYFNKNGIKVWSTLLEQFKPIYTTTKLLSIDFDENLQPIIYTITSDSIRIQKLDRNGNKIANTTTSQKSDIGSAELYHISYLNKTKSFAYFKYDTNNPQKTIFSKRNENWEIILSKEVPIKWVSDSYVFNDSTENYYILQNVYDTYPNYYQKLTKISPNGEVIFSNKRLSEKTNVGFRRYNYYFDSQNNLNLYLILENGFEAKIDYLKISSIGDIVSNKELNTLSSRASESKKFVSSFFENNYGLSFTKQGNLLMSWTKQGKDLQELYISKFDLEGNMLWKEDKLIGKDTSIFSVQNTITDKNSLNTFYSTGKMLFSGTPIHSTNFYINKLSENGNFNELKAETSNKICTNDEINIKIQPEGTYEKDNQYKVFLSDAKGSFSTQTQIAVGNETEFKIPKIPNLTEGTYKIKIVSSSPVVEINNPLDLKVSRLPTLILTQSDKIYRNDSTLIKFDMIGSLPFKLILWDDKEYSITSNSFERYLKPTQSGDYAAKYFSDANCFGGSLTFKITLLEPLSAEENADLVRIYPNYQTQTLELFFAENVASNFHLSMYSMKGEKILESSKLTQRIDLKPLNHGIYIIKGFYNGRYFTKKFMLEKF